MKLTCIFVCAIILKASGAKSSAIELPSDFLFDGMLGNNTFYTAIVDQQHNLVVWLTNFGIIPDRLNVSNEDPDLMSYIEGRHFHFMITSLNQPQKIR
jgi:hypothetical protein